MVGSPESFLIVFHALQLLCITLMDMMTYSNPFFVSSVFFCQSVYFQIIWCRRKMGCLNTCSCMLYMGFLIRQLDREYIPFDILLVCVF